jgi:hypothetical protein
MVHFGNHQHLHWGMQVLLNPERHYVELPYTLPQDSTLFLVLRELNNDIWKHKLDWIAMNGGMALVIPPLPPHGLIRPLARPSSVGRDNVTFCELYVAGDASRFCRELFIWSPPEIAKRPRKPRRRIWIVPDLLLH